MGVIFNKQNSQFLTWSLPTGDTFRVHGQNRPAANLPVIDFRSQPREKPLPKPLKTQFFFRILVFFPFFPLLGKFERHCL